MNKSQFRNITHSWHKSHWLVATLFSLSSLGACAAGPDDPQMHSDSSIEPSAEPYSPSGSQAYASSYNRDDDVTFILFQAENAITQGDIASALDLYVQASDMTTDPKVAERALSLAAQYGDLSQAGSAAVRLLELQPGSEQAMQAACLYHLQQKQTDAAIAVAERYLLLEPALPDTDIGIFDDINPDNSPSQNSQGLPSPTLATKPIGERMLEMGAWLSSSEADTSHLEFALQLSQRYPNLAEAHYIYGVELLRSGDASEAALEAETAMRLRKGWERPRILQAQAAMAQDDLAGASDILRKAIQRAPRNTALRLEYALLLAKQDDLDAATEQYQQILGYEQQQPQALAALGRIAIAQGDTVAAKGYFQQLVQNPQFRNRAALWLGRLAQQEDNIADALSWYTQVRGPEAFEALLQVGQILYQQQQIERATQHFEQMREWFPSEIMPINLTQAELISEYDAPQKALPLLDALLVDNPNNPQLILNRGMINDKIGQHTEAWQDYARVTVLEPDNAQAWNAWGYSLTINTQRYTEAERMLDRALELEPESFAILDSKGWLLFKQGKTAEALPYLQKAWNGFRHPEVAAHLGEALWVSGARDEAELVWREGAAQEADQSVLIETLQRLGVNLESSKNYSPNRDVPPSESLDL